MSKIEVNQISSQCGSTLTIGQSGDTVTLACGATQTGFGRTGTVDWNTTAITADPANAVSGTGYFANTTSAAFTITLPTSPSAGDIVAVRDYAQTFATNNLTIGRNGQPIDGQTFDLILNTNGQSATLVYVDGTQGWKSVNSNETVNQALYVTATGGTESTCGNYKIHTFTGPGTFSVSCAGNPAGSATVDYLVIAGGAAGAGGQDSGGGGGAGGYRFSDGTASGCYCAGPSPLGASALPVTAISYPITVGAGGNPNPGGATTRGGCGNNSIFSTITSAAGGSGGLGDISPTPREAKAGGNSGGSGGGSGTFSCGAPQPGQGTVGAGNTPPVSPPQGNPGGTGATDNVSYRVGGGGGGAGAVGGSVCNPAPQAGNGGNGLASSITGSAVTRAGGGGGGGHPGGGRAGGEGGSGGGGKGSRYAPSQSNPATAGTVNTGSGGGGSGYICGGTDSGAGGSGIVIIRYKYQ